MHFDRAKSILMFNIFLVHTEIVDMHQAWSLGSQNERNHSPFDQSSQPLSKDGNRVD